MLTVVFSSCKNNPKQNEKKQSADTLSYVEIDTPKIQKIKSKAQPTFEKYTSNQIDTSNSILVKGLCAIYLWPDSSEIEYMKSDNQDDFYIAADDNMFYISQGAELLKKQEIKVISTEKRFIIFEKWNGRKLFYDSNKDTGWSLIFFHPNEEPEIAEFILDNEIIESYFGKLYWRVNSFVDSLYPTDKFNIKRKKFQFKSYTIDYIQLQENEYKDKYSIACRSWLTVLSGSDTIDSKYFDNIEAVGGCAGLFLHENQPLENYFIASKFGDYSGRILLIDKNGKINEFSGGEYCLSMDKKYLFSQWDSDITGLTVINLETGDAIFSKELPFYFHGIYEFENEYFLFDTDAKPEKSIIYKFDFDSLNILKVENYESESLNSFNKIVYLNSVHDLDDCVCN